MSKLSKTPLVVAILLAMATINTVSAETGPDCSGLSGPFLVNESGELPADWPSNLNFAVFTYSEYEICSVLAAANLDANSLETETESTQAAPSTSEIQGDAEGWVPGTPSDWQNVPGYSPANIIPMPTGAGAGVIPDTGCIRNIDVPAGDDCSGRPIRVTLYSLPSVGSSKPKGGCQQSQMMKVAQVLSNQFFIDAQYSCLGNSWSWDGTGDARAEAQAWYDGAGLSGGWYYAMAWVRYNAHNGYANGNEVALAAETCDWNCVEWPHAMIAQHEFSHLFGANDKGVFCNQGYGVMNECHAYHEITDYDKDSARRICNHFGTCKVAGDVTL